MDGPPAQRLLEFLLKIFRYIFTKSEILNLYTQKYQGYVNIIFSLVVNQVSQNYFHKRINFENSCFHLLAPLPVIYLLAPLIVEKAPKEEILINPAQTY